MLSKYTATLEIFVNTIQLFVGN